MLTQNERKQLKEKLPHNWASILADRCGLSKSFILKVMNGERVSLLVEEKAIELAYEQTKTKQAIQELHRKIK